MNRSTNASFKNIKINNQFKEKNQNFINVENAENGGSNVIFFFVYRKAIKSSWKERKLLEKNEITLKEYDWNFYRIVLCSHVKVYFEKCLLLHWQP